jgi:hypothetical protein
MNKDTLFTWLNSMLALAVAIIIGSAIFAYAFYQSRALSNTLSVTGSATKDVVSDHVKWVSSISRIVRLPTLKAGHAQLATDLAAVEAFLKANGVPDESIVISPVSMMENYDQSSAENKSYTLRQTIEVNSGDVAGITNLTKHTEPLIDKGLVFNTDMLDYTYSKLPEERVAMLELAMKDAKDRAAMLAQSTGRRVGNLRSASSGVVQVLSENSLDVSDYGSYDTSKINKTIMITVKAAFSLQ